MPVSLQLVLLAPKTCVTMFDAVTSARLPNRRSLAELIVETLDRSNFRYASRAKPDELFFTCSATSLPKFFDAVLPLCTYASATALSVVPTPAIVLYVAVYVVSEAGVRMLWTAAPPSDQPTN